MFKKLLDQRINEIVATPAIHAIEQAMTTSCVISPDKS